jgi:hypothetical protein
MMNMIPDKPRQSQMLANDKRKIENDKAAARK